MPAHTHIGEAWIFSMNIIHAWELEVILYPYLVALTNAIDNRQSHCTGICVPPLLGCIPVGVLSIALSHGFTDISICYICILIVAVHAVCSSWSVGSVCLMLSGVLNILGHEFPYAIHLSSARNEQGMDSSNSHVHFVIRRRQRSVEPSSNGKHVLS